MKRNKNLIVLLGLLGFILAIPSIKYLIEYKTIDGYNGQNYYFINNNDVILTVLGACIFAGIVIGMFIAYLKLVKNSDKFENIKSVIMAVLGIGLIFIICLPNTSSDMFYYMGSGRILSEYNSNPYYYTAFELLEKNNDDLILKNTGVWGNTTVVYGPVWVIITFLLNKISFNSVTLLLYIFKFAALIMHLAICFLIYKITNKKKFVVLYAFNPLILLEFLVNVHNDIYMLIFVFLAIYFLKKKKNILLSLIFLALSVAIKYISIILFPFMILYYLRDKKMFQKIRYICLYSIIFILLLGILYLPWFNSISDVFNGIFSQQGKVKDSVYLLLTESTNYNATIVSYIYSAVFFVFLYFLIIYFLKLILRENTFKKTMKYVYNSLIFTIFGIITNLTSWYLTWLFIPFFWIRAKDMKDIIWLQFLYEISYTYLMFWHSDNVKYTVIIIPIITIGVVWRFIFNKINKLKVKKLRNDN